MSTFGPDGLLNHPASEEASDQEVGAFIQHAPEYEGGGIYGHHL